MQDDNVIKLIEVQTNLVSSFTSLITLTSDIIGYREEKVKKLDQKLQISNEDILDDIKFKEFLETNRQNINRQNVYLIEFDYLFYNSIFVTLFSLFEIQFVKLGKICEQLSESDLRIKDLKGTSDIDMVRKYMHLVCELNSAKPEDALWKDIEEFKSIRNAITHNENQLNKTKTTNLNSIKGMRKFKQHNIKYSDNEVYFKVNNVDFLVDFTVTCEKYVHNLVKEIFSK